MRSRCSSASDSRRVWVAICALGAAAVPAAGQAVEVGAGASVVETIRGLALEDLLNSEVTSVLRKPGTVFDSPSAVAVITAEDLRRAGVRHLPEAMRLVPGMFVAQLDPATWTVNARGMGQRRNERGLQVLVDGRSVYSPALASVYWDSVNTLFEDIERIEVIRGPGGSTWGANAASGVINIITKSAAQTPGLHVSAGGGTVERAFGEVRYGTSLGASGAGRAYVKAFDIAESDLGEDDWYHAQGGLRTDWELAGEDALTVQGDFYGGERATYRLYPRYAVVPTTDVVYDRYTVLGGNVLAQWVKPLGPESELNGRVFYDYHERRGAIPDDLKEQKVGVELGHRLPLPLPLNQELQYGLGYQYFPSEVSNRGDPAVTFDPRNREYQQFSVFVQDEARLVEDRVRLIVGARLEYHEPSGWDVLPNARLSWSPAREHQLWASVSRAVVIPDRSQIDTRLDPAPGGPINLPGTPAPVFFIGTGSAATTTEKLAAYELGYRWAPTDRISFDVAGFYNDLSDVVTGEPRPDEAEFFTDPFPHVRIPLEAVNVAEARVLGVELAAAWQVLEDLRLSGGYTYTDQDADDPLNITQANTQPQHMLTARPSWTPLTWLDLDLWFRYVAERPTLGVSSYFDLDARVAVRPHRRWELAVVGQNLVDSGRIEASLPPFFPTLLAPVERSVYAEVTYRF